MTTRSDEFSGENMIFFVSTGRSLAEHVLSVRCAAMETWKKENKLKFVYMLRYTRFLIKTF